MDFFRVKNLVNEFFANEFKSSGKIVELKKKEDLWVARVEVIEESDYVRKLGKADIIGLYELEIGNEGEMLGFRRLLLRERGDLIADKRGE